MKPRLSLRLSTLLRFCRAGLPLWDLCCDHGYLGEAAWRSGEFTEVIFNDAVASVLEALRLRLTANSDAGHRFVGGPAEGVSEPLTGNVVLAGIGAEKILRILRTHQAYSRLRAERLVLCPEKDAEWLAQQSLAGYELRESVCIKHNHGTRWVYVYDSCRLFNQGCIEQLEHGGNLVAE